MIEVWGRTTSINTQKVLWTLGELDLSFRRHDAGGPFGGLDLADYTAANPNRRIPTLRDGDLTLWESNAIVRYLAAEYGRDSLWIEPPGARAEAERWMDWQHTTLLDPMRTVFVGLAQTPASERDDAAIQEADARLLEIWGRLDRVLRERPFVAGDALTMADIPCGAWCHRYQRTSRVRAGLEGVDAWYERLAARPAYRRAVVDVPL